MKNYCLIISLACYSLIVSIPAVLYGQDIQMNKTKFSHQSDITGIVQCENGEPASRALVYLVGESFMAKTDDEGSFMLHAVPPGSYDMEIEAMDNSLESIPVDVSMKMTLDLGLIIVECEQLSVACVSNNDCVYGEFCEKPDSDCNAMGICAPLPADCSQEYVPVCGCDWRTYYSKCIARESGTNVRNDGWCDAY